MEPQIVDIGPVLFDRASEKEVSIHNRGRVQFTFDIDPSGLSRPSVCDVTPKTGTVMPGQHAVLKLKVGQALQGQGSLLIYHFAWHYACTTRWGCMFCWHLQHCIQTRSCSYRFSSLAVMCLESLAYSD